MADEVAIELGDDQRDVTLRGELGDIDFMTFAIEQAGPGDTIRANPILDVHRRLLSASHLGENAGKFR